MNNGNIRGSNSVDIGKSTSELGGAMMSKDKESVAKLGLLLIGAAVMAGLLVFMAARSISSDLTAEKTAVEGDKDYTIIAEYDYELEKERSRSRIFSVMPVITIVFATLVLRMGRGTIGKNKGKEDDASDTVDTTKDNGDS